MKNLKILVLGLLLFALGCDEDGPIKTGNPIVDAINEYRFEMGLKEIPLSVSLTTVAEIHANDLDLYHDINDNDNCNMHSWSENGNWSSCCYTRDHAQNECMWSKPSELTSYTDYGYENAAYTNTTMTAELALELWIESKAHHDLIINNGVWKDIEWNAIGAAQQGGYAVVWFGAALDIE